MIENVDWSLHWIEFGDVFLDVVEAVLVCPAESVSPHELGTGGERKQEGKEKRAREGRSVPLPVHPTFTVYKRYARFGRSVLKTRS